MRYLKLRCSKCSRYGFVDQSGDAACIYCGTPFERIKFVDVNGYVYMLTNHAMPGLVKIGYTERPVEERVNELSAATGVPTRFSIQAYFGVEDPRSLERDTHSLLGSLRVENSEFFRIAPLCALIVLMEQSGTDPAHICTELLEQLSKPREIKCHVCGTRNVYKLYQSLGKQLVCGSCRAVGPKYNELLEEIPKLLK